MEIIKHLEKAGVNIKGMPRNSEQSGKAQIFAGMTFVLTGTLSSMTRDEAGEEVLKRGGKVSSSVSAKTNYVVYGEKAGSKLANAEKLGVALLDEEGFKKLIS